MKQLYLKKMHTTSFAWLILFLTPIVTSGIEFSDEPVPDFEGKIGHLRVEFSISYETFGYTDLSKDMYSWSGEEYAVKFENGAYGFFLTTDASEDRLPEPGLWRISSASDRLRTSLWGHEYRRLNDQSFEPEPHVLFIVHDRHRTDRIVYITIYGKSVNQVDEVLENVKVTNLNHTPHP